ncbi:CRISPR-associated endonuclease Cas1 [Rhodoferax antarcticus]|uniref:CRISPR-associated endonuclease Cas1 n=1 Tax=Rhodoferax antarcticus ANT.BR TaxID=1111071 RepID=A0A1Q8YEX0_9BURK|nr:CRISPR-associated endonuclease Cas1 [Rhodoferax antarcticus]APW48294.1 CRISPR-associated endonuclease Cas1 [Rhodoferax antarcticus]MCW2313132.1 CRISPR-associated protein Cas1 [Rhodoferax antarcticus]OLP06525.1 CRISPR-associated protein Cas1 [Rhodoferax antarcticus ANT.BR]
MALLLLDRAQLDIKSEGETLALYEAGVRRGTVPIKLIDRCVIHGAQTRLDSGVLIKLAQAGATTVLMSPRGVRRVALVLGPQHNDAAVRLAQSQHVLDDKACCQWAHALVRAKLQRQQRTLKTLQTARPDARKPLFDALHTVNTIRAQLGTATDIGPAAPPTLASLRGYEGAAARAYFAGLSSVFAPALNFTGRNRRPPRDPVNVCLSLSYSMAHVLAVQACVTAGLDPLLGFYHRPAFGRESLASDLIEPLRPAIDLWVWELLRSRTLREEHFSQDKGACLLGKAGRAIYYAEFEKSSAPWRRWLRGQTQALARNLRQVGELWLGDAEQDEEAT